MTETVERAWARENPLGVTETDPGPIFHLWNFGINEIAIKPKHAELLVRPDFLMFVREQLRAGQKIEITGAASTSGRGVTNQRLARQRAEVVKGAIIVAINRGLPEIASSMSRGLLSEMLNVTAVGADRAFLTQAGGRFEIPLHDEGGQLATNRRVSIWPSNVGRFDQHQIEIIGRKYLAHRWPKLRRDIRFLDLWHPAHGTIEAIVPTGELGFSTQSSRRSLPSNFHWGQYSPGYRAAESGILIDADFVLLRTQLAQAHYSARQVENTVERFMNSAAAATRLLSSREQSLARWIHRTGQGGGSSLIYRELRNYYAFRNPIIVRDPTCAVHIFGYEPLQIPLPAGTNLWIEDAFGAAADAAVDVATYPFR